MKGSDEEDDSCETGDRTAPSNPLDPLIKSDIEKNEKKINGSCANCGKEGIVGDICGCGLFCRITHTIPEGIHKMGQCPTPGCGALGPTNALCGFCKKGKFDPKPLDEPKKPEAKDEVNAVSLLIPDDFDKCSGMKRPGSVILPRKAKIPREITPPTDLDESSIERSSLDSYIERKKGTVPEVHDYANDPIIRLRRSGAIVMNRGNPNLNFYQEKC